MPGRRNYIEPSGPAKAEPELDPNFLAGRARLYFFFLNSKMRGGGEAIPVQEAKRSKRRH